MVEGSEAMLVGKLDGGKIVQVLKFAYDVKFSEDKGWLLIDPEIGKMGSALKWVPATTRFEWVKAFTFRSTDGS